MLKHFGNYTDHSRHVRNHTSTNGPWQMQHDQSPSQFNSSKFNSDLNQTPACILSTKTYFRPEHDTASEAETVKEWTLSEYRLTSNKVGR